MKGLRRGESTAEGARAPQGGLDLSEFKRFLFMSILGRRSATGWVCDGLGTTVEGLIIMRAGTRHVPCHRNASKSSFASWTHDIVSQELNTTGRCERTEKRLESSAKKRGPALLDRKSVLVTTTEIGAFSGTITPDLVCKVHSLATSIVAR